MVSHIEYSEQYGAASLSVTNAISELADSVDTQDFNKAFWKVQQASEQCKRVRAAMEQSHEASVRLTYAV